MERKQINKIVKFSPLSLCLTTLFLLGGKSLTLVPAKSSITAITNFRQFSASQLYPWKGQAKEKEGANMLQCISSGARSLSTSLGKGNLKTKGHQSLPLLPHGETGPSPLHSRLWRLSWEAKDGWRTGPRTHCRADRWKADDLLLLDGQRSPSFASLSYIKEKFRVACISSDRDTEPLTEMCYLSSICAVQFTLNKVLSAF